MSNLTNQVSYLKGLAEGMNLSEKSEANLRNRRLMSVGRSRSEGIMMEMASNL